MAADTTHELGRKNAELSTHIEELSKRLAQCEALTQLAAGTVHDLRNVFQVALMAAETLLKTLTKPDDRELVQTIQAAAEHGTLLSQDLLTLARKPQMYTSPCAELLPQIKRLIERSVCPRLECRFEVTPALGSLAVEATQLEAALVNISINARDATPHGGSLQVHVQILPEEAPVPSGLAPGAYVQFALTDNGPGMSPEVLARATEAFFTTKESSGGTGLGLATAHAFATRSGGALLLDSQLGQGTCVRLILPRASRLLPRPNARVDKLLKRIRSPELQRALAAWRDECPADGLPLPASVEARLIEHQADTISLCVIPGSAPHALRLLRVGAALSPAIEQHALAEIELDGPTHVGTLASAYRRALQSRAPSYEYARYVLADGAPGVFERLILPTAADGLHVSHLTGMIIFCGAIQQQETGHHRDV